MAITRTEKAWLFRVFLILVLASAGLEIYVVVRMIELQEVARLGTVVAVVNGTGLAALLVVFVRLLTRQYLLQDFISERHLQAYVDRRLMAVRHAVDLTTEAGIRELDTSLSRACLRLLEEILRDWYGNHRFQLSVFANPAHPEIVCYWDTANHELPRSHNERLQDRDYYRKQRYAVIDVIEQRSPDTLVVADTRSDASKYSYVNAEQRQNIGSTLLFRFSTQEPGVLVVACDQSEIFHSSDTRLWTLVSAIGIAVRSEWELGTGS